jgi:hypothetical protein
MEAGMLLKARVRAVQASNLVGVSNPLSEYLVTEDLESGNRLFLVGKYI